jgi:hypothetical protein
VKIVVGGDPFGAGLYMRNHTVIFVIYYASKPLANKQCDKIINPSCHGSECTWYGTVPLCFPCYGLLDLWMPQQQNTEAYPTSTPFSYCQHVGTRRCKPAMTNELTSHVRCHTAKVDYPTKAAHMRADFADVAAKQKILRKMSWRFEGRRRMVTLRKTISDSIVSSLSR